MASPRFYFGSSFGPWALRDALKIFFLLALGAAVLAYGIWAVSTGNAHSEFNN